eukprot:COSAG01_NODE_7745_length_3075_cov_1.975806_1_plen_286_part_00
MSLQAWMLALRPLKVGFLMKQGQEVQSWKKRWCMVWRTQLAYFENHNDVKERKGYILLRDCIPDRLFAVPRSVFGHDNIFQVETSERTFFMQAISGEDMQEWLDHINTAIASRGPANGEEGDGGAVVGAGATMQPAIGSDDPQMLQDSQPQWSEQQPNGAVDAVGSGYGGYDDPTAGDGTGADQRKLLELQERERRLDEQESILSQRESILESSKYTSLSRSPYLLFAAHFRLVGCRYDAIHGRLSDDGCVCVCACALSATIGLLVCFALSMAQRWHSSQRWGIT